MAWFLQLGSGTDPVEGGCLAAVLLEWLLTRARLTFCTSHHADLKELSVGVISWQYLDMSKITLLQALQLVGLLLATNDDSTLDGSVY